MDFIFCLYPLYYKTIRSHAFLGTSSLEFWHMNGFQVILPGDGAKTSCRVCRPDSNSCSTCISVTSHQSNAWRHRQCTCAGIAAACVWGGEDGNKNSPQIQWTACWYFWCFCFHRFMKFGQLIYVLWCRCLLWKAWRKVYKLNMWVKRVKAPGPQHLSASCAK